MLPGTINDWLDREWLLTNNRGGYASGTIINCPARRFHGNLAWNRPGMISRWMLWSHTAEHAVIDGRTYLLNNFEFNNAIDPHGYQHLASFDVYPDAAFPSVEWVYRIGTGEVRKRLWLDAARDRVCVQYDVAAKTDAAIRMQIWPLIACREAGQLRRKSAGVIFDTATSRTAFSLRHRTESDVAFAIAARAADGAAVQFIPRPDWWYNFKYRHEAARGIECGEDLFVAGSFVAESRGRLSVRLMADAGVGDLRQIESEITSADPPVPGASLAAADADGLLAAAGRQFVIEAVDGDEPPFETIVAGYPWLESFSRDACVSLPGLLLDTGRYDVALRVLRRMATMLRNGLLPNHVIDDAAEHEYTAADEPLWFIYAVDALLGAATIDGATQSELIGACRKVLDAYTAGTSPVQTGERRCKIAMDAADGLISCEGSHVACTWMDARNAGRWITPRLGKPVDVNALWYHALRVTAAHIHTANPGAAETYTKIADKLDATFAAAFWDESRGYLADVVTAAGADDSLRPNQLFAIALPNSPLADVIAARVLDAVSSRLLTPFGLRTLAPGHADYRGRYEGGPADREMSAHQGAAYPWLMGLRTAAYLRVNGTSPRSRAAARAMLMPLIDHLRSDAGLGGISELFDGDEPHTPRGCINQAWSVAEVARAWRMTDANASSALAATIAASEPTTSQTRPGEPSGGSKRGTSPIRGSGTGTPQP